MPRETVRGSDYQFVPIPDNYEPEVGENPFSTVGSRLACVEVGWQKYPAGGVEIAVCDEVMVAEMRARFQHALVDLSEDPLDAMQYALDLFAHSAGWWVHLDREGCNALIKKLRKARDSAYGRDA